MEKATRHMSDRLTRNDVVIWSREISGKENHDKRENYEMRSSSVPRCVLPGEALELVPLHLFSAPTKIHIVQ